MFFSDIDECATKTDECPPHSRCKNTVGSYTCQCIEGYLKDNERCKGMNILYLICISKIDY